MQDLAHSALRMIYSDVRPEEFTPSSGGGASRKDFLVKAQVAAVEVKVTRSGRGPRDIKPELLVDINDYKGHPAVKTLVAVIYDIAGTFDNPGGFEADMSRTDGELEVIVIVAGWPTTPQRP